MAFPPEVVTYEQKLIYIGQLANGADSALFSAAWHQQSRKYFLRDARQRYSEVVSRCADLIAELESSK